MIDLGDRELQTVAVPGQALHQVAYYETASDALFTAEAAGTGLPDHEGLTVTTPLPIFGFDAWLNSQDAIRAVGAGMFLYSPFGPYEAGP